MKRPDCNACGECEACERRLDACLATTPELKQAAARKRAVAWGDAKTSGLAGGSAMSDLARRRRDA